MNGLPPDVDLSFLVRQALCQICFGEHDLQLHFAEGASISVEGECLVTLPGCSPQLTDVPSVAANLLSSAMSDVLAHVRGSIDGTLLLSFGCGVSVELRDSNAPYYESYVITCGDVTIVV